MNRQTLILASKSPRRKELLEKMSISFEVMEADIDSDVDAKKILEAFRNAARKESFSARRRSSAWTVRFSESRVTPGTPGGCFPLCPGSGMRYILVLPS